MNWQKMTNQEMALHLDFWLVADGSVTTETQRAFFEELIFRLTMSDFGLEERYYE